MSIKVEILKSMFDRAYNKHLRNGNIRHFDDEFFYACQETGNYQGNKKNNSKKKGYIRAQNGKKAPEPIGVDLDKNTILIPSYQGTTEIS